MTKRGQATLFIIIGIVLVVIIALYFVAVSQEIIPPILGGGSASSEMADVDNHIRECLDEVGTEYVTIIGLQGGYLSPSESTYRLYNDTTVSYLCWDQVDVPMCTNRMLTIKHMEEELKDAIDEGLKTCINVNDYSSDAIVADDWDLTVEINRADVELSLYYPVSIDKGDDVASEDSFVESLNVPLGELYDVSQDIVNDHAVYGDFEQLIYMLTKLRMYNIYKLKPYPDVLYKIKLREGNYIFQFAIQGEDNTG